MANPVSGRAVSSSRETSQSQGSLLDAVKPAEGIPDFCVGKPYPGFETDDGSDVTEHIMGMLSREKGCVAPFVASPEYRVRKLVELACLNADDLLLDIGCGDGSLLATARKLCGCRGLGFDIDAPLIAQARLTYASDPGLEFQVSDFTEVGFTVPKPVTAVAIYLLPSESRNSLANLLVKTMETGTLHTVVALRWPLQTKGLSLDNRDAATGVYVYT